MAEKSIPDNIMDGIPDTKELIANARTARWYELGIMLGLDAVRRDQCNDYDKMYQLWLDDKGDSATRRALIKALRDIRQAKVADDYVKYLIKLVSPYN